MNELQAVNFSGESLAGINFSKIYDQLRSPDRSSDTANNLARFVLHRLVVSKYAEKLRRLTTRLDLSDLVQTVMKSIFTATDNYKDRPEDEIRLIIIRIIQNKANNAFTKNLCQSRDVRRECRLEDSPEPTKLNTHKRRQRDRSEAGSHRAAPEVLQQLETMTREQAIAWIQRDFSMDELERFEDLTLAIPESHQLTFWFYLTGMTATEIATASEFVTKKTTTRNIVIHRIAKIRKILCARLSETTED